MTLNFKNVAFLKSLPHYHLLPQDDAYEIAFAGRSNAGKSTLINTLCENKSLTKTSGTPGKTRDINLFSIMDKKKQVHARLVDLPGYGYAKVGKKMQQMWQKELSDYLTKRENLKILILIMDARHPLTELDDLLVKMISHRSIQQILVFNKIDKLKQSQKFHIQKILKETIYHIPNCHAVLHSSTKNLGTKELRLQISSLFDVLKENSSN
ncbi:MAG: ribosome biogenesis GTP-binding protein YihA/YsxC [Spirochaetia bacterium]